MTTGTEHLEAPNQIRRWKVGESLRAQRLNEMVDQGNTLARGADPARQIHRSAAKKADAVVGSSIFYAPLAIVGNSGGESSSPTLFGPVAYLFSPQSPGPQISPPVTGTFQWRVYARPGAQSVTQSYAIKAPGNKTYAVLNQQSFVVGEVISEQYVYPLRWVHTNTLVTPGLDEEGNLYFGGINARWYVEYPQGETDYDGENLQRRWMVPVVSHW